jgi:hypothetical protein
MGGCRRQVLSPVICTRAGWIRPPVEHCLCCVLQANLCGGTPLLLLLALREFAALPDCSTLSGRFGRQRRAGYFKSSSSQEPVYLTHHVSKWPERSEQCGLGALRPCLSLSGPSEDAWTDEEFFADSRKHSLPLTARRWQNIAHRIKK